jgi:hypothetical protein
MRNQTEIEQFQNPATDIGDKRKVVHNLSTLINARLFDAYTKANLAGANLTVPRAVKPGSNIHIKPTPLEKMESTLKNTGQGFAPAPEHFLTWRERREESQTAKRARIE